MESQRIWHAVDFALVIHPHLHISRILIIGPFSRLGTTSRQLLVLADVLRLRFEGRSFSDGAEQVWMDAYDLRVVLV